MTRMYIIAIIGLVFIVGLVVLSWYYVYWALWVLRQGRMRVDGTIMMRISPTVSMAYGSIPRHIKLAGHKFRVVNYDPNDLFKFDLYAAPEVLAAVNMYIQNDGYAGMYLYQFIQKMCQKNG
jgi:hypothetical protein